MKHFLLLGLLSLNLHSADLNYDYSTNLLMAYQTLFDAQALDKWLEHQQNPRQAQSDVATTLISKYKFMNQDQKDDDQNLQSLLMNGILIINQWVKTDSIDQISSKISVLR